MSEDVVGGNGNGFNVLVLAVIEADIFRPQRSFVYNFAGPLLAGGDARGQDERRGLEQPDAAEANDGLACAARQDNDAAASPLRAARVEGGCGLELISAQSKKLPG